MKHPERIILLVAFIIALLLAGCSQANNSGAGSLIGSVQGQHIEKTSAGEELFFTIAIDQSFIDAGQPIAIRAAGTVESGWLRIIFRDPDGNIAWDPGEFGGDFTVNTFYQPPSTGNYRLGVAWKDATTATYDVSYQGEQLTPLALAPGLGMILVAIAFIIYSLRKGGTWSYLGLGALAWTVTVAIKMLIALVANAPIYQALYNPDSLWAPGSILFYLYIGALTGLTEVLLTWLVLRYTRLGRAPWNKAFAFGAGFGAFEALLLGLSSLFGMLVGLLAPQTLPAAAIGSMLQANNLLFDLAPIVERIATIFVHILCNVLLFYAIATRRSRWLWVSFVFKTLLDSVAGFAQLWGVGTIERIWIIEAVIIIFGILGWGGTRAVARRYPSPVEEQAV